MTDTERLQARITELEANEKELLAHIEKTAAIATDNEEMAAVLQDVVTLLEQGEFQPAIFLAFINDGKTRNLMQYHRDYFQKPQSRN